MEPSQSYSTITIGRKKMIELEPGTILEREYKGNKIKVKVLKNGNYSYNGKEYESRGDLMKAVAKGKTAQFTTFFGIAKGENKAKKSNDVVEESTSVEEGNTDTLEDSIRAIVRDEIQKFFRK